jgi:hypothetical protein
MVRTVHQSGWKIVQKHAPFFEEVSKRYLYNARTGARSEMQGTRNFNG